MPKRELHPNKLLPPPEATKRFIENEKNKLPRNKILKFFVLFFGEGF